MDDMSTKNHSGIENSEQDNNQNTETSLTENLESFEKFMYHFDDPLLKETGYVQVFKKKIIVLFPERVRTTNYSLEIPNIQFFINKQLVLHYNWLPVFTSTDLVKCKDMFARLYFEYSSSIGCNTWPSSHFYPKLCDETVTVYNTPSYFMYCFENSNTTSVELELKVKNSMLQPYSISSDVHNPIATHVQFYIGSYLTFCSETTLKNLDAETISIILSFILYKLVKY